MKSDALIVTFPNFLLPLPNLSLFLPDFGAVARGDPLRIFFEMQGAFVLRVGEMQRAFVLEVEKTVARAKLRLVEKTLSTFSLFR